MWAPWIKDERPCNGFTYLGQGGLHLANFGFIKIVGGRRVNYDLRMLKINLSQLPSPDKGPFLIGKMKCKKPFDLEKSDRGILKS